MLARAHAHNIIMASLATLRFRDEMPACFITLIRECVCVMMSLISLDKGPEITCAECDDETFSIMQAVLPPI